MPYAPTTPPEDLLLATRPEGVKLYAYLATCELYATVRILGPALPGSRRRSFWLGWNIEDSRWTRVPDYRALPLDMLEWAAPIVRQAYPNLEAATGMSAAEIAELKAEQQAKRARYKKT
jgi:hypothetical protein